MQVLFVGPHVRVLASQTLDAHELLIRAIADHLGVPAGQLQVAHACERCGSTEHGVPSVWAADQALSLRVSLSRAPGIGVVAFGTVDGVGVDVEPAEAAADPALDSLLRHPDEPAVACSADRTRRWVRKEAALKAWGVGLNELPLDVQDTGVPVVDGFGRSTNTLLTSSRILRRSGSLMRRAEVTDLQLHGYCVAVAEVSRARALDAASRRTDREDPGR